MGKAVGLLPPACMAGALACFYVGLRVKFHPETWANSAVAHGYRADWILYPPLELLVGFGLLCLLVLFISATVAETARKKAKVGEVTSHGSARLATTQEVRRQGHGRKGVVLCMEDRAELKGQLNTTADRFSWVFKRTAPLICNRWLHVFVEGPTGAGKGESVMLPTLLTDVHRSYVILDPKGELWDQSAAYRSVYGHVRRFAPTEPGSAKCNPLLAIPVGTDQEVVEATRIATVLVVGVKDDKSSGYFYSENALPLLVGAIVYVLHMNEGKDRSIPGAYKVLFHQANHKAVITQIMEGIPEYAPELKAALESLLLDPKSLPSAFGTCRNALRFCMMAPIREALSGTVEDKNLFEPRDLFELSAPLSVYFVWPFHHASVMKPVARMLLDVFLSSHRRSNPRQETVYLLDELPSIGAVPSLLNGIRELRGFGVQLVLAAQSESDLYAQSAYGIEGGQSIIANCRARVYLSLAGQKNLKELAETLGKSTFVTERETTAVSRKSLFERTITKTAGQGANARELLTADELRALPEDQSIVVLPGLRPYIGKRALRYAIKELKRRSELKSLRRAS